MALKTVGASGQISLGKKYSGKHFDVVFHDDGSVQLNPMKVVPEVRAPARSGKLPRYRRSKVRKVVKLSRDQMHER